MPHRGSCLTNPIPRVCEEVNQEYQKDSWISHLSRNTLLLPPPPASIIPLLPSSGHRGEKKPNHLPTWLAEETRDDDADYLSQFVAKCEKNMYFFLLQKWLNSQRLSWWTWTLGAFGFVVQQIVIRRLKGGRGVLPPPPPSSNNWLGWPLQKYESTSCF